MDRLVLWDIDQTLIEGRSVSRAAYAAAFHRVTGGELTHPWQFNGRTELAAASAVLRAHGVDPAGGRLEEFLVVVVQELQERAEELRAVGRVLRGAVEALTACAGTAGLHQSVLTGNLYPIAVLKTSVFGLDGYLNMAIGGYGGDSLDRTELVGHAWQRAHSHLGIRFAGADTVIVGDTQLDVATGKAAGARVVAVATGPATPAELEAAGADVVFADLSDTDAVMDAVLA